MRKTTRGLIKRKTQFNLIFGKILFLIHCRHHLRMEEEEEQEGRTNCHFLLRWELFAPSESKRRFFRAAGGVALTMKVNRIRIPIVLH